MRLALAMTQPRAPAVAGRFYPSEPTRLDRDVRAHLQEAGAGAPALAIVAPHAGYAYSGAIAGSTWARVAVPRRVVLLCPNHTGLGARRSLWSGGSWRLPGGDVEVDDELRESILLHARVEPDMDAHLLEHAIEVHLPFLRARRPDARIVPICLGGLDLDACRAVGDGLARAIAAVASTPAGGGEVLVVASTDMSHYLPAAKAAALDRLALDRIGELDAAGLHHTVRTHGITMCGFVPTTVALFCAVRLGARRATLVRYGHSGETTGDDERVVGYAGFVVD